MIATIAHAMTVDDRRHLPDDNNRYELINGELTVSAAPKWDHQVVSRALFRAFDAAAVASNAGEVMFAPVDVIFNQYTAVEPDLLFILSNRVETLIVDGVVQGAPDIVVEVISPSSRFIDRVRKFGLYASMGVTEYWIADPESRELVVHSLIAERYETVAPNRDGTIGSRVLPGLIVDPATLHR